MDKRFAPLLSRQKFLFFKRVANRRTKIRTTQVYLLLCPIDLTTTFCLFRRIPCVVHSMPCRGTFCRWSSAHKIKCLVIPFFAMITRPALPLLLKYTFKNSPRFWETRDQPQPGSFLNDNGDPGNEVGFDLNGVVICYKALKDKMQYCFCLKIMFILSTRQLHEVCA